MPADFSKLGLPSDQQLTSYRIWDSYFTPSHSYPGKDGSERVIEDIERSIPAIEKAKFERLCYFAHVGIGTTSDKLLEQRLLDEPRRVLKPLERWPQLLMGMIQLNPKRLQDSLRALDQWLRDGPMLGVYFPGGGPAALNCGEDQFIPLVKRIGQIGGVIMQHTWFKTGGKSPGHSTPTELAQLAAQFPDQQFICAHAGGEWEKGILAVRNSPNILVETSGFDATAGFIEMAVRELSADRIIFGSHLPSRSLGTELSKVTAADISEEDKQKILGQNYRKLMQPILNKKR